MPYVAIAVRDYGEGRICIHTDRIGGVQTGHGSNPSEFWRKVFEWTSSKQSNELIKVGLIVSSKVHSTNRMNSFTPITVSRMSVADLGIADISGLDCLYFAGLPTSVSQSLAYKIRDFVNDGGGVIIEYPDRGQENINVLSEIEDVWCYSAERTIQTYAYWTNDGGDHYIYTADVDVAFMPTLRQADFSSSWSILMFDIENVVTSTTTTSFGYSGFDRSASSEFGVSYLSMMQKGIVTVYPLPLGVSSSSSSSSSSVSSSSSSSSIDSSSSSSSLDSSSSSSLDSSSSSSF